MNAEMLHNADRLVTSAGKALGGEPVRGWDGDAWIWRWAQQEETRNWSVTVAFHPPVSGFARILVDATAWDSKQRRRPWIAHYLSERIDEAAAVKGFFEDDLQEDLRESVERGWDDAREASLAPGQTPDEIRVEAMKRLGLDGR